MVSGVGGAGDSDLRPASCCNNYPVFHLGGIKNYSVIAKKEIKPLDRGDQGS